MRLTINMQKTKYMVIRKPPLMCYYKCFYSMANQLLSKFISRDTKCELYKTVIRPVLAYGCEAWAISKNDEELLGHFERKILRRIYETKKENDVNLLQKFRRSYRLETLKKT